MKNNTCLVSSLRSQFWMRLFLKFLNTVNKDTFHDKRHLGQKVHFEHLTLRRCRITKFSKMQLFKWCCNFWTKLYSTDLPISFPLVKHSNPHNLQHFICTQLPSGGTRYHQVSKRDWTTHVHPNAFNNNWKMDKKFSKNANNQDGIVSNFWDIYRGSELDIFTKLDNMDKIRKSDNIGSRQKMDILTELENSDKSM